MGQQYRPGQFAYRGTGGHGYQEGLIGSTVSQAWESPSDIHVGIPVF